MHSFIIDDDDREQVVKVACGTFCICSTSIVSLYFPYSQELRFALPTLAACR